MAGDARSELVGQLGVAVAAFQEATDAFDEAAARRLGVNRTDLRCLGLLVQDVGPTTPSVLADRLGLTSGSVTTMLDRLERLNYLSRTRESADRRKVLVSPTPELVAGVGEIYGPMVGDAHRSLADYSDADLQLVISFLRLSERVQYTHRDRIR